MQHKDANLPQTAASGASADASSSSRRFRERFKQVVASSLYHSGLLRLAQPLAGTHELTSVEGSRLPRLRRFAGSKFGILCYHRVGTEGVPLFSRLEPRVFEAQMRYIKKHYRVVPLGQMCRELQEVRPVAPTLAVTFDDGYRDLYTYAFPVLQKYGIPATIYLIGQCMETGEAPWYDRVFVALKAAPGTTLDVQMNGSRSFELSSPAARAMAAWEIVCYLRTIPDARRREWCAAFESRVASPESELSSRMLDWDQVRTMHRGGVSFGAHTMTHPAVSRLDAAELESELGLSKRLLENGLGVSVEDFAYPFGKPADCSAAAERFLGRRGYRSAVTTVEGINSAGTNMLSLHRLQIGDDRSMSSFAFTVTRMFLGDPIDSRTATQVSLERLDFSTRRELGPKEI